MADLDSVAGLVAESERLREVLASTVGELRGLCDALRETVRDLRAETPPGGQSCDHAGEG